MATHMSEIYLDLDRLAAVCRTALRQTPEYQEALREGIALDWLRSEAMSMAYLCQEAIYTRLGDLEPPGRHP